MCYAIRKLKIFFLKWKFDVLPLLPGVWKIVKTHYNPKNENHCTGVFDSSNEAFWCTDYNAKKNPALCKVPFQKNQEKSPKITIFKKWQFFDDYHDFLRNWTLQRAGVFCVVISASKRFIWAIKHAHKWVSFFGL